MSNLLNIARKILQLFTNTWSRIVKPLRGENNETYGPKYDSYMELYILIIIFVIIMISRFMIHIAPQDTGTGSTLDLAAMEQKSIVSRQSVIANNKVTYKEDMEKMYGGTLMEEDYSDVKARLDKEIEELFKREVEQNGITTPYFIKSSRVYFNSGLKEVKEKKMGIEDVLVNYKEYIHDGAYEYFVFGKSMPYFGVVSEFVTNIEINPEALMVRSAEEWSKRPEYLYELMPYYKDFDESDKKDLEYLKKKYGEDFLWIPGSVNTYAPRKDPTMEFEIGFQDDKYLSVLAQKYLYGEWERILKEEGLADKIAHVTFPRSSYSTNSDNLPYDTPSIKTREDKIKFLNDGFIGNYNVNWIYLQVPGEDIDYEALHRALDKASFIITKPSQEAVKRGASDYGEDSREAFIVNFYVVSPEERKVAKALFERDKITENYFRSEGDLSDMYLDMTITHENTDGFKYLDVFGEPQQYGLYTIGCYVKMTTKEFVERLSEAYNRHFIESAY